MFRVLRLLILGLRVRDSQGTILIQSPLARRILLACAGLVLLYSSLAARHQWVLVLPSADRG